MEFDQGRRRSARRIPPEGEAAAGLLIVQSRRIPVLILDESVEGMGLVAVHAMGLPLGDGVAFHSVVRHLEGRIGSVRHVRMCDTHISCIGLQWTD